MLAMGEPAEGYPFRWSIYRWIDGETAAPERIGNRREFAASLARFLVALQRIDAIGGPAPGAENFHRGGALSTYDAQAREAISELNGKIDGTTATTVWGTALASQWHGSPVWVHGDVSMGNLLVQRGRLSTVIDFGSMAVGDPACDFAIAWTTFDGESREAFRAVLAADAATWVRARGWALWKAMIVATGLADTNKVEGGKAWQTIEAVLIDHRDGA